MAFFFYFSTCFHVSTNNIVLFGEKKCQLWCQPFNLGAHNYFDFKGHGSWVEFLAASFLFFCFVLFFVLFFVFQLRRWVIILFLSHTSGWGFLVFFCFCFLLFFFQNVPFPHHISRVRLIFCLFLFLFVWLVFVCLFVCLFRQLVKFFCLILFLFVCLFLITILFCFAFCFQKFRPPWYQMSKKYGTCSLAAIYPAVYLFPCRLSSFPCRLLPNSLSTSLPIPCRLCLFPVDFCLFPVNFCPFYPVDVCLFSVDFCLFPENICQFPVDFCLLPVILMSFFCHIFPFFSANVIILFWYYAIFCRVVKNQQRNDKKQSCIFFFLRLNCSPCRGVAWTPQCQYNSLWTWKRLSCLKKNGHNHVMKVINGSQLAKMKKSIPDMSLP